MQVTPHQMLAAIASRHSTTVYLGAYQTRRGRRSTRRPDGNWTTRGYANSRTGQRDRELSSPRVVQ